MENRAYLDHHTASKPFPSAVDKMLPYYSEHWGATTQPHRKGQELILPLEESLVAIKEVLGAADEDHFHFFSSGSDAISSLFFSHYFHTVRETGKNHMVTTQLEEAPILLSLKRYEELGCSSKIVAVNAQGQLTREMLAAALRPRTGLVSLSWASGLTGVIHPIADLAELCHQQGVLLHVDASYVIGKLYFRFEDLPVDYLTMDGQFLHAPKGTAGLLCKRSAPLIPFASGPAGVAVGGIASFSEALDENGRLFDHLCLETARLRDRFEAQVKRALPDAVVFFETVDRLPNCTAIGFPGVVSDALLFLLSRKGVSATLGGGHCQTLSHILIACGVDPVLAQSALSFSLSFETSEAEIDYAVKMIVACVEQLKRCSAKIMEETP